MLGVEERPPIAEAPISVVLPARNLETRISHIIETWTKPLEKLQREYEIILVDDGSTGGTASRAEALAKQQPRLRVLRHERPRGFGAALRTGLEASRLPLITYAPADFAGHPSELKKLLQWIDKVDLVAGVRVPESGRMRRSWRERFYHFVVRHLFGVRMRDPLCRWLLARRSIFARIPIQSVSAFAHVEILAKANFLGCLMAEAAVTCRVADQLSDPWLDPPGVQIRDARVVFSRPAFGPIHVDPAVEVPPFGDVSIGSHPNT